VHSLIKSLLFTFKEQVGGYDLYNIYDRCKLAGDDVAAGTKRDLFGELPDDSRFGACGQERALSDYCNEPAVRAALHVPSRADIGRYYGSEGADGSNNWGTGSYTEDEFDTHKYITQLLRAGGRVLVHKDPCCEFLE